MVTDEQISELVALVARWALASKFRIVTAESCTGGWIAKAFTDAAGSSRWFECGYVTYSNEAKMRDLGVSARTLMEHGAVSERTAREMAAGALQVSGADVSIAVSGIAGPDGGSVEKPVGTVWFCIGRRGGAGVGGSAAGAAAGIPGEADRLRRLVDSMGAAGVGGGGPGAASGASVAGGVGLTSGPNPDIEPGIDFIAEGEVFAGNRETVRRAAVKRALELVLQLGEVPTLLI